MTLPIVDLIYWNTIRSTKITRNIIWTKLSIFPKKNWEFLPCWKLKVYISLSLSLLLTLYLPTSHLPLPLYILTSFPLFFCSWHFNLSIRHHGRLPRWEVHHHLCCQLLPLLLQNEGWVCTGTQGCQGY